MSKKQFPGSVVSAVREEWDTHKGKADWGQVAEARRACSGLCRGQRTQDTDTERSLEDGWGDLGGQVGEQDQHRQRPKGMLGSGLFKSFNMAGIGGVLEEMEMKT